MLVVGIELDLALATLGTTPLQMDLTTRRLDLLWMLFGREIRLVDGALRFLLIVALALISV